MSVSLSACGRYADFTLPVLPAGADFALTARLGARPVMERGAARDVLNPSVVFNGHLFFNLYSEWDGSVWRTALADSKDGSEWTKRGRVLSPDPRTWERSYIAANGSALWDAGEWRYWFVAGERELPRIGLATSRDGRAWKKESGPVMEPGPRGSWDERGVADPYVLKLDGTYYLYYLGQDRARRQRLGLARSADGVRWTKLRSNPVIDLPWAGTGSPAENGLGEPAVWRSHGWYWMLYTGRSRTEQRALIAARSRDGVRWETAGSGVFRGSEAWDREVVCDPTVLWRDGLIRLWFGGGNVARPDENLNGQIGEGEVSITPRKALP